MSTRKEYELTTGQYDKLIEACRPTPLIMLQCGMPRSPQENCQRRLVCARQRVELRRHVSAAFIQGAAIFHRYCDAMIVRDEAIFILSVIMMAAGAAMLVML